MSKESIGQKLWHLTILARNRKEVYHVKIDGLRENRKHYTVIGPVGRISADCDELGTALDQAIEALTFVSQF